MSVDCWPSEYHQPINQYLWCLLFDLQADEEIANDLNGTSDIDLATMKPSSASNTGPNSSSNRRNQPMDMNMYATRKTIAQGNQIQIKLIPI